jgi:hypothetical protein
LKNSSEMEGIYDALLSVLIGQNNTNIKEYLLCISDEELYSSIYLRSIMSSTEGGRKYFMNERRNSIGLVGGGSLAYLQATGVISSSISNINDIVGEMPTDEASKPIPARRTSLTGNNIRSKLSAFSPNQVS